MSVTTMTADELEDEVLNWLSQQNVGLLDKVYQLGTVTCKDEWKGKKSKLLKGLLSHMTSLSDEDAEILNLKIYKFFTEDLDTKPKMPALEVDDADNSVVEEVVGGNDEEEPQSEDTDDHVSDAEHSEDTDDTDEDSPVRRSSRVRNPTSVFTYDSVGGNPTVQAR